MEEFTVIGTQQLSLISKENFVSFPTHSIARASDKSIFAFYEFKCSIQSLGVSCMNPGQSVIAFKINHIAMPVEAGYIELKPRFYSGNSLSSYDDFHSLILDQSFETLK